jgi:hypothetical protein
MRARRRPQLSPPTETETSSFTDKQQAFVRAFVESGGKLTQAAIDAGYSPASAASAANIALRNPLIQNAIYAETRARFARHAPEMQSVVMELAQSARSGMVRLLAAQDWLDRAGFRAPEQHHHLLAGELKVSIDLGPSGTSKGSLVIDPAGDPASKSVVSRDAGAAKGGSKRGAEVPIEDPNP